MLPFGCDPAGADIATIWSQLPPSGIADSSAAVVVRLTSDVTLAVGGHIAGVGRSDDVWSSADNGETWTLAADAPGFGPRIYHMAVALIDGSALVMGGTDGETGDPALWPHFNDLWRSSDGGESWTPLNPLTRWSGRRGGAATVMPGSGEVIVAGGMTPALVGDVWASTDGGHTWSQRSDGEFPARAFLGLVGLAGGTVVVAGGYDGSAGLSDVHRSTDGGVTFTALVAAGWGTRYQHVMVGMFGSLFVAGGFGDAGAEVDVWRSDDAGSSWQLVVADAGWAMMEHGVALASGELLLARGVDEVWLGSGGSPPSWSWHDGDCAALKYGLCGAPLVSGTDISVVLPAAAGHVQPPNSVGATASTLYLPPVPKLVAWHADATITNDNVIVLNVTFSQGVEGLLPEHFTVDAGAFGVAQRDIAGAGRVYNLNVTLTGTCPACPSNYHASPSLSGEAFCVRVIPALAPWHEQVRACAPYALASIHSEAANGYLSSVLPVGHQYWCVLVPHACCASVVDVL